MAFAALVCSSSLQYVHRKFILGIFPGAETFLPTFWVVTKSRSSKTKLGITPLTTLKPVWLFSQLLNETYKRDRLQKFMCPFTLVSKSVTEQKTRHTLSNLLTYWMN